LLSQARELGTALFLSAAAACFREAWRVVDGLFDLVASGSNTEPTEEKEASITREQGEDVM